jgi:hypothetical protein
VVRQCDVDREGMKTGLSFELNDEDGNFEF